MKSLETKKSDNRSFSYI